MHARQGNSAVPRKGLPICDLYGWSSEKERQKPQKAQNDDVVCPLPRGAKTPKICALCVLCGWSLHPTVHVANSFGSRRPRRSLVRKNSHGRGTQPRLPFRDPRLKAGGMQGLAGCTACERTQARKAGSALGGSPPPAGLKRRSKRCGASANPRNAPHFGWATRDRPSAGSRDGRRSVRAPDAKKPGCTGLGQSAATSAPALAPILCVRAEIRNGRGPRPRVPLLPTPGSKPGACRVGGVHGLG